MTVRLKITLLITAAGFLSSLLFSAITLWEMMEQPFDLIDAELKHIARRAVRQTSTDQAAGLQFPEQERYWLTIGEQHSGTILQRSALARQISMPDLPSGEKTAVIRVKVPESLDLDEDARGRVAFRVLRTSAQWQGREVFVTVARPIEELEEELWDTVGTVAEGLTISVLLLFAASYVVAGLILRPIRVFNLQARDISERHLERRLPVTGGKDEFNALAQTLNRVFDRLQHAFLRQKSLIADASHELKTPLTMMRLALDSAQEHLDETANELQTENYQRLSDQVLRMERLVKNLLDLSSLEAEAAIRPEPIDLGAMLESLLADYRLLAEPRHIRIETSLPPQLHTRGDADKLYRALSNLLDNAVKYNVAGGEVQVAAQQAAAGISITIRNTGPGIPEEERARVFEQFYRVDKSRSLRHGGSGLGLAIVKRIVELHQGTVQCTGSEDGWTVLSLTLPSSPTATKSIST